MCKVPQFESTSLRETEVSKMALEGMRKFLSKIRDKFVDGLTF